MAAPDKLVSVVALLWLVFGLWHMFVLGQVVVSGLGAGSEDWGEKNCQGSQCHDQWRDQLVSCQGTRQSTFQLRYILVGFFGSIFGALGINAVPARNSVQIRAFSGFLMFMTGIFLFCLAADVSYVQLCGKMPTNMAKDVLFFLPREVKHTLKAQGFMHLERLPILRLKQMLKMDFVLVYIGAYMAAMCVMVYVALQTYEIAGIVEGGPLGLGPVYGINYASKEHKEHLDALMGEIGGVVPQYDTLLALQDAQKFPYTTVRGARPAVSSYCSGGVDKNMLLEGHSIRKPKSIIL